jgi:hypothetical protein
MLLIAPAAAKIIQFDFATFEIAYDRIYPVGQLHGQAFRLAAKKLRLTLHRWAEAQPLARRLNGSGVTDFGFNANDVGHTRVPGGEWIY